MNHTVESFIVNSRDVCEINCFLHKACMSYNLGPQEGSEVLGNSLLCELSNSDHLQNPQDMETRTAFSYVAFEVRFCEALSKYLIQIIRYFFIEACVFARIIENLSPVYTDNFLYMTIFICHIKTNRPVLQQIIVIQELVNFVHLNEQIKIVTIKIVT
mgnify:CR=1 FL=1